MPSTRSPRIILLGASNVARSLSPLIATAMNVLECGGAADVLGAVGRGRSYGARSSIFGRSLCGILQSDLWPALQRDDENQKRPTYALITDIGNDIMYGHSPGLIAEWIGECIERLKSHDASIILTSLPMERIASVNPRQFRILRTLLFPSCTLTFREAIARGEQVMGHLQSLSRDHDLPLIDQPREWYGIDPIHIRIRHWPVAWREILSRWRPEREVEEIPLAEPSLLRWLRLTRALPEEFRIFGINVGRHQPACRLAGGTRVWMY